MGWPLEGRERCKNIKSALLYPIKIYSSNWNDIKLTLDMCKLEHLTPRSQVGMGRELQHEQMLCQQHAHKTKEIISTSL